MRISQEILDGLKQIGETSLLDEQRLENLLKEISTYLEFPLNPNHSVDIPPDTPEIDVLKVIYASLLTFLIEGMRRNEDPLTLKCILGNQNVPDDRVEKILDVYTKQKLPLRLSLKSFNSNPPHIFDVTWKMHFCVKTSFSDFDGKLLYFIQLIVGKNNSIQNFNVETEKINFVCTVNQLKSLVATLKAATRHLESIAER
ncbi:COMM domain-containing protein 3-like [Cimex lectularius]|uniref:COMM domain-containing protein 3 n=1 Tax=Cimex lectularius TaxID=79782 RepID=A0A8I6RAT0_CIMLE|nr:COMM domain-containing protein 3-like [Cimex lectularius]